MLKLNVDKKIYSNGYQALGQLRLVLPDVGLYAITGESGCGKSTLLNCIGGMDDFEGELICDGKLIKTKKDVENYRRNSVSTVFQDFKLIRELNVKDNISLAGEIVGKKLSDNNILNLLTMVGLPNEYADKKINELSYGEMQRVAIARAVAKNARIIIADEPTANLDSENGENIMALLKEVAKDALVVLATHNIEFVDKYCDGYVELSDGDEIKNTLPQSLEDVVTASKHETLARLNFSLFSKLFKNQGRKNAKNIALSIVTVMFLVLSALCIAFSQITLDSARKYTLNSNDKTDKTVFAKFVDNNGSYVKVPSDSLGNHVGLCDLDRNNAYNSDLFSIIEYSDYLTNLSDGDKFYGNSVPSFRYALFSDSIDSTGLKLAAGKSQLSGNQVIIPSLIADILISLGKTTEAFTQTKQISQYDDLLGCEFSVAKLLDGQLVEIAGIYKSPTKHLIKYGKYKISSDQFEYDLKAANVISYNCIVLSKAALSDSVDGIVLDYGKLRGACFDRAAEFASELEGVKVKFDFLGAAGLDNAVRSVASVKLYLIIPLCLIMTGLVVLTAYISLSSAVSRNREQILTLRALGMNATGITGIYLCAALLLSLIQLIFMVALVCAGVPVINLIINSLSKKYLYTLLGINALTLTLPMIVLVLSNVIFAFISVLRLFGKSVETKIKET